MKQKDAIENGADEIDMVMNIGWLKDKKYQDVEQEIRTLKEACGDKILKVIIETCLLTEEEKIKMCELVTNAGADYIKTSTGFSTGGATFDDIQLFAKTRRRRCEDQSGRWYFKHGRCGEIPYSWSRPSWNQQNCEDREERRRGRILKEDKYYLILDCGV